MLPGHQKANAGRIGLNGLEGFAGEWPGPNGLGIACIAATLVSMVSVTFTDPLPLSVTEVLEKEQLAAHGSVPAQLKFTVPL